MAGTSADMSEFVRKDVYEADQRALIAEIRLGNAEIMKKIEQVETKLNARIDRLEIEIDGKIEKVNSRINQLETKVEATNMRIDAMNTRIDDMGMQIGGLYSLMSWGVALIAVIVAFLLVISPVAAFFKKLFKPSITLEQVDNLITARLSSLTSNSSPLITQ